MSCIAAALLLGACNDTNPAQVARKTAPSSTSAPASPEPQATDARRAIGSINDAIPIYQGADFRNDLSQRDEVEIRGRFGEGAEVYTLATDDSFPQVYHYYTTYLSQFRAFPAQDTYPPERREARSLELRLNEVMQDPFIPGEALDRNGKQVTLQIAESDAEPRTVIRYIVTPAPPPGAPVVASNQATPGALPR